MPENDQSTAQGTWDLLTCELDKFGNQVWRDEDGEVHRDIGPAIIYPNGNQYWAKHGKYHREDGPAIILSEGNTSYWLDDVRLTEEEFNVWKQLNG